MTGSGIFHPLIYKWFTSRYPAPTDIQAKAWPVIAAQRHVLITAPTGNGKTLTAFLWALDNLLTGKWKSGALRVLYISPLKALNNDIRINLLAPLAQLKDVFREAGTAMPEINILVRSGDTPQKERSRMLRHPPEILITTPESFNILLNSPRVRPLLASVQTVILDEIHALADNKRGTYLITAVERLTLLAGEFQRIAISATVNPPGVVADLVAGYELLADGHYRKREVQIIKSTAEKKVTLSVRFPADARETMVDDSWWPAVVNAIKGVIRQNKATLIFTNSRALCEKITRWINENEEKRLAYAHHGSLSKELRKEVEKQLKAGELAAIIATSSLELGIDIGELDEVVLVQTPFSIASALQRIGRAGHAVNKPSIGIIFPTHGRDFLEAAVMSRCIAEQEIETLQPVLCPLDILAQVILAMTALEEWDTDRLYAVVCASYPFHGLSRKSFDLVIKMLGGYYAETRIAELNPRISLDAMHNTLSARPGVLKLLYMSGGTIPDRGYFEMRVKDSGAKIGELDEEFVWERRVGHSFNLGTQDWKITGINDQRVEVVPWGGQINTLPFWKAEQNYSAFFFSEKIGLFLEQWDNRLHTHEFTETLTRDYLLEPEAAEELVHFLKRQRQFTGAPLPHRHHLLIEHYSDIGRQNGGRMLILHTLWGGKINHPFALALNAALETGTHANVEIFTDNHCIMLLLPGALDAKTLVQLVTVDNLETLLRNKLEKTGFFGARFRENAGRALLLPKPDFGKRVPFWLNRLRSRKLLESVLGYEDFPIIAETWRTCLQDNFDLDNLRRLLLELATGKIRYTEVDTDTVSPMADSLVWRQVNQHMYEDDTPVAGKISGLSPDIFKEVLYSANLRPGLDPQLVQLFTEKIQRTKEGYAPGTARELLDWVKDRLLLPLPEWDALLAAMTRDYQLEPEPLVQEIADRIVSIRLPGAGTTAVAAVDTLPRLLHALELPSTALVYAPLIPGSNLDEAAAFIRTARPVEYDADTSLAALLVSWLHFYGPVTAKFIRTLLGVGAERLNSILIRLTEQKALVSDKLIKGAVTDEICTAENLELLLRLTRQKARPGIAPLEAESLPLFLALAGGLAKPGATIEDLMDILEKLFGCPAQAGLWESDIFPARIAPYRTQWLDALMQESGLQWFGCAKQTIAFTLPAESDLFLESGPESPEAVALFPHTHGKYGFWELKDYTGLEAQLLSDRLWELAWQGMAANDSFTVLRTGLANNFKSERAAETRQPTAQGLRMGFQRWKAQKPTNGAWFLLKRPAGEEDALSRQELTRERIRQLFSRYGMLSREILAHDLPLITWSRLFRTLQIMELSGEVYSGYFFKGLAGIQFLSQAGYRLLMQGLPADAVFWLNAQDPLSLCGKGIKAFSGVLPSRLPSNHLVYHGSRLVLVSRRKGSEIEILVPPEDNDIPLYLALFQTLVNRSYKPLKTVKIESINGIVAGETPYRAVLLQAGFEPGYNCFVLRRKYTLKT